MRAIGCSAPLVLVCTAIKITLFRDPKHFLSLRGNGCLSAFHPTPPGFGVIGLMAERNGIASPLGQEVTVMRSVECTAPQPVVRALPIGKKGGVHH